MVFSEEAVLFKSITWYSLHSVSMVQRKSPEAGNKREEEIAKNVSGLDKSQPYGNILGTHTRTVSCEVCLYLCPGTLLLQSTVG